MCFLLFPAGRHQAARRRLFWNVALVVTAVVANWLALFTPPSATEGHVVRACLVGWMVVSLAATLAAIASGASAETRYANLGSAAATLLWVTSSVAAFAGAETTSIGFDVLASFLCVVGIRTEQQLHRRSRNADSFARVHVTLTLAAGLWVLAVSTPRTLNATDQRRLVSPGVHRSYHSRVHARVAAGVSDCQYREHHRTHTAGGSSSPPAGRPRVRSCPRC